MIPSAQEYFIRGIKGAFQSFPAKGVIAIYNFAEKRAEKFLDPELFGRLALQIGFLLNS